MLLGFAIVSRFRIPFNFAVSFSLLHLFLRRRRSAHSRPLRIALLAHGGTQWMGGELYVRNLFMALLRYREKSSSGQVYELIVFTSDPPALLDRHPAFLGADDVVACPRMNDGPLGRLTLIPLLLLSRIDFAYPCYSPLPPWPGLHGSGWMTSSSSTTPRCLVRGSFDGDGSLLPLSHARWLMWCSAAETPSPISVISSHVVGPRRMCSTFTLFPTLPYGQEIQTPSASATACRRDF
jgi:hypothetical protein